MVSEGDHLAGAVDDSTAAAPYREVSTRLRRSLSWTFDELNRYASALLTRSNDQCLLGANPRPNGRSKCNRYLHYAATLSMSL